MVCLVLLFCALMVDSCVICMVFAVACCMLCCLLLLIPYQDRSANDQVRGGEWTEVSSQGPRAPPTKGH